MSHWWICPPIQWIVFLFCYGFLCCAKPFQFAVVPFVYFSFVSLAQEDTSENILLWEVFKILLPMFSSGIFMVSSLTFKSLIHFELICLYGVRRWSSFILCMHLSNFPNTIYFFIFLSVFFKKYIYWLCYYSCPISPLHSTPSCPIPPSHIPAL